MFELLISDFFKSMNPFDIKQKNGLLAMFEFL